MSVSPIPQEVDGTSTDRPGAVARVLLWMLDFYQKGISPLTPPSCRFQPTCSQYAVEAVRVHGALKGSALALWRLLKCAPWHPGGWDPVPPRRGADPPACDPDTAHDHPTDHRERP